VKVLTISQLCPSPGVEHHLFVHEQLSALPIWDDAFGLVSAEAMAWGTPAVAGKGECAGDCIADDVSGSLCPVRAPDALASIIAKVLDDPAKAAAIGVAGRAAALEPSWERDARLTLAAYERVHATTP